VPGLMVYGFQRAQSFTSLCVTSGPLLSMMHGHSLYPTQIRVINTWKEVWGEDAEEFRPERWLDLPPAYNSTFSLMSFIAGPHACIGRTMGISEMKAVLAYASLVFNHFAFLHSCSLSLCLAANSLSTLNLHPRTKARWLSQLPL